MTSPNYPTLAALITAKAEREPDLSILTFVAIEPDGSLVEERRSFRELHDRAQALASGLHALGLRPGQSFAIMMQNHPEFVEAMIAASMIGAVFVPIDPRTMGDKLQHMLSFAECRGVICAEPCADAVLASAGACEGLGWLIVVGSRQHPAVRPSLTVTTYASLLAPGGAPPPHAPSPDDPMFMMFTSGTTGAPKAVVQSHRVYMAAATAMRALGIGRDDVLYTGLSLTHINAQGTLRTGLALSAPVVVSGKFTKSRLWDICRRYGCTVFNLLGGMIPEVFSAPSRPDDHDNPVRLIISAGMPAHLWNAYRERFGVEICEVYGATEGGGAMFNPPGVGPIGSMGRPGPTFEALTFDEQDRPCGPNEPGELRFRRKEGPAVQVDYFKNAAASATKVQDGWFRTGDIVHYDDQGWFFFHHRIGGGVRRNGDFVNTALVESVIIQSGLAADIFVYGVAMPGDVAGEKALVAAIVPAQPERFQAEDLLDYCRSHLQRNDVPEIVQVVCAIPKTVSEKPIELACIELLRAYGLATA